MSAPAIERRKIGAPTAELSRLAAAMPEGALDALERCAKGFPMFGEASTSRDGAEARSAIVAHLRGAGLVIRLRIPHGANTKYSVPSVTALGRELLAYTGRPVRSGIKWRASTNPLRTQP